MAAAARNRPDRHDDRVDRSRASCCATCTCTSSAASRGSNSTSIQAGLDFGPVNVTPATPGMAIEIVIIAAVGTPSC
jgi:hypothetical protein